MTRPDAARRLRHNCSVWATTVSRRVSTAARNAAGYGPDRYGPGQPAVAADGDDGLLNARTTLLRRIIVGAIVAYFLLGPVVGEVAKDATARNIFLLAGALVFIGLLASLVASFEQQAPQHAPWVKLTVIVGLAIVLFLTDGKENWLVVLALAAAACGRFAATPRPAIFGAVAGGVTALAVAISDDLGNLALVSLVPALGAFFAYVAGKRYETLATLRQTRAELARVAVAEERLRIARDLHDLLGHSLSLITLKAELSRRMIATDVAGAEREMADLESVARQSLSDVRAAVAGYRQPDLAAELGAARQLLTAAGIACRISAPPDLSLPAEADTVLAWAVREGVTNVVRHARATSAAITISSGRDGVTAEITDNGRGGGQPPGTAAGSGLAGLGERARQLGGHLTAGPAGPTGFRLLITVPPAPGLTAPGLTATGLTATGLTATGLTAARAGRGTADAAVPAASPDIAREPAR
jgi:two-component system sensor histidine kinase DesK